jgi:hypothetical protein
MKRNHRLWLSSGLLFLILLAGFLGWQLWENNRRPDQETSRDLAAPSASTLDKADSSPHNGAARTKKSIRGTSPPEKIGRSYGTLQREAKRIFGEAEATRTTKLGERFADGTGSYLYKTHPPSPGEIETLKAQIADLRKEAGKANQEKFDDYLDWLVDSFDPYGADGERFFLIQVPTSSTHKMHAFQISDEKAETLREKFMKGELSSFSSKQGWLASNPGETLDRFEHLMIWEPEKD